MHNEDLHNLCPSPYVIRTISVTISWAEHVAHMVTMWKFTDFGCKI
jgi:hypothetical protein